ncbi:RNA ligase family protein [Caballeronia sp. LZ032]|uniref:RNA ligase family protein n=1 Tax=Caballeronia sp. LZ032 TaxID=3038565 RepID=UPI00285F793E|nr:RNA ligase family protein [Caballeronia sp. LZ032]MDR5879039.1 RNA ligase family protein [Caballeronia sp. LZ032]
MEFKPFPKTPRLKRDIIITEKLDGTNAQVVISFEPLDSRFGVDMTNVIAVKESTLPRHSYFMRVGSRTRWITPGKTTDNYGFAGWCRDNADELFKLGEGQHFGEWYGQGIQRGYGLDHKRFALFNTARWGDHNSDTPKCCEVVPVLRVGPMASVEYAMNELRVHGSSAVPGFDRPEGIIVYHTASQQNFKVLIENDHMPKGETNKESA